MSCVETRGKSKSKKTLFKIGQRKTIQYQLLFDMSASRRQAYAHYYGTVN